MSRHLRQQRIWPGNSYARFLWLGYGLAEEIQALADVYKSSNRDEVRLALARHVLGDFDSLDELLKEFHNRVKQEWLDELSPPDAGKMRSAFRDYHRAVQPHKQSLKEIRNHLAFHRTGEPWRNAPASGETLPEQWGRWEQHLLQLEARCDLTRWVPVLNSAFEILNLLKDFNLAVWFSTSESAKLRLYIPILPHGYYPRDAPANQPE